MELLYAKRFSKDLDSIQKESTRKALLKAIKAIKKGRLDQPDKGCQEN